MKKYLLGILAISISVGGYGFAGENCDRRDFGSQEHNDCLAQQQQIQQQYQQNTTADPCLVKVSSSLSTSATCDKTPKEDLDDCRIGTNSSNTSYKCATRYSCETLFTDSKTANKCNFARCETQRGKGSSYCTCKYGSNGDGIDKGIPLNTSIPFLGNCLKKSNPSDPNDNAALNAFPTIISVASRILITVIMLVGFVMIVIGGIQWSTGKAADGKKMISKVVVGFALLGAMGAILRLINPNFFK